MGKLWTLCPVDVEEDDGEGEMVRRQEPVSRRTKPRQEHAMHCPAGLRVPVFCLLLVRLVCMWCVYLGLCLGWVKWTGYPLADAFTPAAGPQEFISQDWIRPGLAKVQGLRDWQAARTQTREIERAKPKPREGVSLCAGAALPLLLQNHPHHTHTIRAQSTLMPCSLWLQVVRMLPKSVKRTRIDKHIIKRVSSS